MASFAFNFSGDDIKSRDNGSSDTAVGVREGDIEMNDGEVAPSVPVKTWSLDKLLQSLPSQISYTTTLITSPQRGRQTLIPRRALFDIKMQVMAEAGSGHDHQSDHDSYDKIDRLGELPPGLNDSDIETDIYEGGFKSWEGGLDLARLLLDRGPRKDIDELSRVGGVVELGCGTALPSLVLFQHALRSNFTSLTFTLTDYNSSVLRLCTLPNLLLVWALENYPQAFDSDHPRLVWSDGKSARIENAESELNITTELVNAFATSLRDEHDITLRFVSGAWQDPLLCKDILSSLDTVIPHSAAQTAVSSTQSKGTSASVPVSYVADAGPEKHTLLLASETLYSSSALPSFSALLATLLRAAGKQGKGYVSGKKYYFGDGLGGGWDGFKEVMGGWGCGVTELRDWDVEETEKDKGVERGVLEVQLF